MKWRKRNSQARLVAVFGVLFGLVISLFGGWRSGRARDGFAPAEACSPLSRVSSSGSAGIPNLRVELETEVYDELLHYGRCAPGEITLFATAAVDRQANVIRVKRLLLPRQTCSVASTEVSSEAMAELLVVADQEGIDSENITVWIHSHADMDCFWSSIDEANMRSAFPQARWALFIVYNRRGEMLARVRLFEPFRLDIEQVPCIRRSSLSAEKRAAIRDTVEARVRSGHGYSYGPNGYAADFAGQQTGARPPAANWTQPPNA